MRDIPVGNGSFLVNFDDKYQIRDIYFPHVGQENHTEGFPSRFGVWADGDFSWVHEDEWQRTIKYLTDTLVTGVTLRNEILGLEMICNDAVAGHDNIYFRRIEVRNLWDSNRNVRVFFHHDFRIYENKVGDTAYYDPETFSLIHYKKHRYFLINTDPHFDSFATGRKAFRNSEGTWRDAEDGELHGGAITEGSVDSTIAVHFGLEPQGKSEFHYWIAAGTSHKEVAELNTKVHQHTAPKYQTETRTLWEDWLVRSTIDFEDLSPAVIDLYKRSLLIVRTQIDDGGAIIAANDHDVTERATDHYSYLWPRDGAFVANCLDIAGYPDISQKFSHSAVRLCMNAVTFNKSLIRTGALDLAGTHSGISSETFRFSPSKKMKPLLFCGRFGSTLINIAMSNLQNRCTTIWSFVVRILWSSFVTLKRSFQNQVGISGKIDSVYILLRVPRLSRGYVRRRILHANSPKLSELYDTTRPPMKLSRL